MSCAKPLFYSSLKNESYQLARRYLPPRVKRRLGRLFPFPQAQPPLEVERASEYLEALRARQPYPIMKELIHLADQGKSGVNNFSAHRAALEQAYNFKKELTAIFSSRASPKLKRLKR